MTVSVARQLRADSVADLTVGEKSPTHTVYTPYLLALLLGSPITSTHG